MLLFNISRSIKLTSSLLFQNISCYCLTKVSDANKRRLLFQNISCYCLTYKPHKYEVCSLISKHLMLLFDHVPGNTRCSDVEFQNISCYCLTVHEAPFLTTSTYFKTSHVIV